MYPSQGRCWRTFAAGTVVICCVGCNEPAHRAAPGALPRPAAADLEPKINATTYFAHGHLLERQGQFERAVVQYRKALLLRPTFLSARNRLGITLNKLGRHFEATDEFRQAIADHPNLAHLQNNLGFSLYLQENYAEAQAVLQRALELKPDFPRAHTNQALVLGRLDRFDDAFSELLQVGSEANACFNMGMILTEAERYADAAHYLETALAIKPDFDAARQQLREVARLAAEAQAAAQRALAAETVTVVSEGDPPLASATEVATEDTTQQATQAAAKSAVVEAAADAPVEEAGADPTSETAAPEPADVATAVAPSDHVASEALVLVEPAATAEHVGAETPVIVVADVTPAIAEPASEVTTWLPTVSEGRTGLLTRHAPLRFPLGPCIDLDSLLEVMSAVLALPPDEGEQAAPEPPAFAPDADIDPEFLAPLVNEALDALRNHADGLEELWYRLSCYLFPETAPDKPLPEAD